jgi:hypothetical protein
MLSQFHVFRILDLIKIHKTLKYDHTQMAFIGKINLDKLVKFNSQGVERIAVRYSFKRGDFMRYALMADLPV